jgi:hypothetical protein
MKWWGEHDANCDWKDIPCPLQCGRVVVRKNAEAHMAQECIMRPVPCPYARVGCVPPGTALFPQLMSFLPSETDDFSPFPTTYGLPAGLIFRDVHQHCALNHPYHLALSTAAIDRTTSEVATLRSMESGLRSRLAAAEAYGRR